MNDQIGFSFTAKGLREADPDIMEVCNQHVVVKELVVGGNLSIFPGAYVLDHIDPEKLTAVFRARVLPGPNRGYFYLPERRPRIPEYKEGASALSCP